MTEHQDGTGHEHSTSASAPQDRARFDALLDDVVTANAPRLFAIVVECHDLTDCEIIGWGMAFEDHIFVHIDKGLTIHMQSLDRVLQILSRAQENEDTIVRAVWTDEAATRYAA